MTPKDCVQALEQIVPLKLAGDWDNAGLLVEGPDSRRIRRALLTIDFTELCLLRRSKNADLVIAYHPIFGGPSAQTAQIPRRDLF